MSYYNENEFGEFHNNLPVDQEESEEGRLLADSEYLKVLVERNDIFSISREPLFHWLQAGALIVGILGGIILSSIPRLSSTREFSTLFPAQRFVKLLTQEKTAHGDLKTVLQSTSTIPKPRDRRLSSTKHMPDKKEVGHPALPVSQTAEKNEVSALEKNPVTAIVADRIIAPDQKMPTTPLDSTDDISALVDRGDTFKKQGDHAGAFDAYKRVLKRNPRDTQALKGMGDLFLWTGLLDSSINFYSTAVAANPHSAAAHTGLASARYYMSTIARNQNYATLHGIQDPTRYAQAQYDSAMIEYTAALAQDSAFIDAWTNRGVIRELRNDHQGAIEDYSRALKYDPASAEAYSQRGATYNSLGRYDKALADYTAAIKLDSSHYEFNPTLHFANAYFNRGNVHYKLKELDKAIADFDSCIGLSPRHSLAIIDRAVALYDKKQYDSAIAGLTTAISLLAPAEYNGAKYSAYLHRGNCYKVLKRYDEAIADYLSSMESKNLTAKACWRIADCYSLKSDSGNAIGWLKKSVAAGFKDFRAWERDRDLAALRGTAEFREIVKG
jgi:tetratricopeptide (TPR) repeat protein